MLLDRAHLRTTLLDRAGWGAAASKWLAGDASNRRYDRLRRPDGSTAVLMDADPSRGEDVRPFVRIAGHLAGLGLSAPEILAADEAAGFLLLEDFGDAVFARVAGRDPTHESEIYAAAVDLLAELHRHPAPPGVSVYDPEQLADFIATVFEWYLPQSTCRDVASSYFANVRSELLTLCHTHAAETPVLALRDYHAENLIWLPERQGVRQIGLLDFQDAVASHPAYDLTSLLRDARRDVSVALREAMIRRYLTATGQPEEPFRAAFAVLGVQRNLRILGIFSRLCLRDGKPGYVDLIPRVWAHLQSDLEHPALAALSRLVNDHLPEPTSSACKALKNQCATAPTQL